MMTYPGLSNEQTSRFDQFRQQAESTYAAGSEELSKAVQKIDADQAMERLRNSIGGRIGIACEKISYNFV